MRWAARCDDLFYAGLGGGSDSDPIEFPIVLADCLPDSMSVGDYDNDGTPDLVIRILDVFAFESHLLVYDGALDISDPIYTLSALFTPGSPSPGPPGTTTCGPDPTVDPLDCASYPGCAP